MAAPITDIALNAAGAVIIGLTWVVAWNVPRWWSAPVAMLGMVLGLFLIEMGCQ